MADATDPTNATPEGEEARQPTPVGPSGSEPLAPGGKEDQGGVAPKATGGKPATAESGAPTKAPKKPAKQKKEQPAPTGAASESLSLSSNEVEKPKVVKA